MTDDTNHGPSTADPTTFVVTFRPLASDVPTILRVRKLLKVALRSFDLRCVSIDRVEAKPETTDCVSATPPAP